MKTLEDLKTKGLELNSIYNADCLEALKFIPDKSIDLVVTDPPYNMDYHGRGKINSFEKFANDNLTEQQHTEWFEKVLTELNRVLKDNTAIYIYIDFRNYARIYPLVKKYFEIKNCIVWDKESIGMGMFYRFQHEFCIFGVKGKPQLYSEKRNLADVWHLKRDSSSSYDHPTQKPLSAVSLPIQHSSLMGGGNIRSLSWIRNYS